MFIFILNKLDPPLLTSIGWLIIIRPPLAINTKIQSRSVHNVNHVEGEQGGQSGSVRHERGGKNRDSRAADLWECDARYGNSHPIIYKKKQFAISREYV